MRDDADDGGRVETRAGRAILALAPARVGRRLADLLAGARAGGWEALRLRLGLAIAAGADAWRRDLDGGLALPALVVVFACGIAVYFQLPREPWLPAILLAATVAAAIVAWRRGRGHAARVAATVAALVLGVAAAAVETARTAAPRLDHERTVTVEGRVSDLDATARGGLRLTVEVTRMEGRGLTPETTPTRINATLTAKGWRPDVGDGVRFKARLKPPEGPVLPGGYDFARRAWFEGRGAGGYVLGRATPIELADVPLAARLFRPIGSLRHVVAERVRASLPGATGAIAAALMVGEQRAIPESAAEPLRASGLTHIVSISGLHMGLVAGGVIVAIRAVLALFPVLALGFPIKKWAAAAAFVAATIYLLLSGNQVAALRSHLMLSVALLAVMVDRPAITMHTVAVSAALILAVDPASALEPSFLMSYLAVIALVASYDLYRLWTARRPPPAKEEGRLAHLVGAGLRHVEGLAFSSLVAGLATAPVIAAVFFRGAPYSIVANMVVLPVTGLVIMPAAVISALVMPFGLDHWPLQVMGLGVDWMITVGRWTASLPSGAGLIGASHPAMMPLGIAAVLWLSAWKSRIRLFGLLPALAAVALLFAGPRPDVMIGRHGSPIAVRGGDGRLHVLAGRQDRFDSGIWLAADGDGRAPTEPSLAEGWTCDPLGCVFGIPAGKGAIAGGPAEGASVPPSRAGRRDPVATALLRADETSLGRDGSIGGNAASDPDRDPGAGLLAVSATFSTAKARPEAPPEGASIARSPAGRQDNAAAPVQGGGDHPELAADPVDGAGAGKLEIAVVRHPRGFDEECRRAVLVITTLVAPPGCRDHTTVIDRIDLATGGATTIAFAGPLRPPRADPVLSASEAPPTGAGGRRSADTDPTRDAATEDAEPVAQGRPSTSGEGETAAPSPTARATIGPPVPSRHGDPRRSNASDPEITPAEPDDITSQRGDLAGEDQSDFAARGPDPAMVLTHALPRFPRPWTPVDPFVRRLAEEAAEAERAARALPDGAPGSSSADEDGMGATDAIDSGEPAPAPAPATAGSRPEAPSDGGHDGDQ